MKTSSVTVPARPEFVRAVSQFVLQTARHLEASATANPLFEIAVAEALANAVKHGARDRPDARLTCEIEGGDGGTLTIRILDDGEGFAPDAEPAAVDEPSPDDVASLSESGYGLPIIRNVFSRIDTGRRNGRFCLELVAD